VKFVESIRKALDVSLLKQKNMVVIGQGVWSPFYVGSSMDGLESKYGKNRIIDTPVSENGVTGFALGAAITGTPTVVIHPRMDFMILAMDSIVNAAAKWRYSLNSTSPIPLTIRTIINRGGEQGAQHSQALHSWFAHTPGLRVVMPSCPSDAYQLLIQSIESPDPVIFIEDRWNYSEEETFEIKNDYPPLATEGPKLVMKGDFLTVVSMGYSTTLCKSVIKELSLQNISADLIDMRIIQPLNIDLIVQSVKKTGKLLVVDGGHKNSGLAAEIISSVCEAGLENFSKPPIRITLPAAPAPTSSTLERLYYTTQEEIKNSIVNLVR
jgi:acetoin:2,6-dichlorophenolindophenol oxidoreductase subunit beta